MPLGRFVEEPPQRSQIQRGRGASPHHSYSSGVLSARHLARGRASPYHATEPHCGTTLSMALYVRQMRAPMENCARRGVLMGLFSCSGSAGSAYCRHLCLAHLLRTSNVQPFVLFRARAPSRTIAICSWFALTARCIFGRRQRCVAWSSTPSSLLCAVWRSARAPGRLCPSRRPVARRLRSSKSVPLFRVAHRCCFCRSQPCPSAETTTVEESCRRSCSIVSFALGCALQTRGTFSSPRVET